MYLSVKRKKNSLCSEVPPVIHYYISPTPRAFMYMLLDSLFSNYVVVTNMMAAWIKFRGKVKF